MQSIALVIHVVLAIGVIGLVLMQHGKGADAGAAFGSGASSTVFGARGSGSFLTRATTLLATLFFVTSLFLFYLAANRDGAIRSVTDLPGGSEQAPANTDLPGGVTTNTDDTPAASDNGSVGAESDVPATSTSSGAQSDVPATTEPKQGE